MKLTISDWLMLIYDVVTAIAAIVAVLALKQIRTQTKEMGEQLGQMKAASKQTDDLIAVAKDQVRALSIAADAAQKSADAAKASAEVLVNAERPWLLTRYKIPNTNIEIRGARSLLHMLPHMFEFDLVNLGRTPAEVIFIEGRHTFQTTNDINIFDINTFLSGAEDLVHRRVLAPKQEWQNFYTFASASLQDSPQIIHILPTHLLVFYGIIRYRDTLGGEAASVHETRYFYWFDPSTRDLVMGGPLGANNHT